MQKPQEKNFYSSLRDLGTRKRIIDELRESTNPDIIEALRILGNYNPHMTLEELGKAVNVFINQWELLDPAVQTAIRSSGFESTPF